MPKDSMPKGSMPNDSMPKGSMPNDCVPKYRGTRKSPSESLKMALNFGYSAYPWLVLTGSVKLC